MIELTPNTAPDLPPDVHVDMADDGSLTVTVNLPLWWRVVVSKPVVDPEEPFTGGDVKRLADAAIAAARVLL